MKKILKIAALAAVLALCMILTGCYNAPDDVNNGGPTGTGNALPFQTLAPTATIEVTPDTIVIETQNIFSGETSGIQASTPAPTEGGGNGWNDWGTVQDGTTPTPNPTSSVIVFDNITVTPEGGATIEVVTTAPVTPKPTDAPVTPTPTPPSLQRGFKGSDAVRTVQKRLKELGYYNGSADGDFGPATEAAVKAFQRANGLTADGKVGKQTLAKMNAKTAVSAKQASATAVSKATAAPKKTNKPTAKPTVRKTNTPRPTATPNLSKDYYLDIGAKGKKVETLQRRLIELGWLTGRVTGKYDEATQAAVLAFQRKTKGLWEDGIAGPDTLQALYSSNAARNGSSSRSNGTSDPSGSSGSKPDTLEMGSTGSEVRRLQQKLKDLGYLSGSVDGTFGVATQAAVIAFQKNNNLTADGKAGTATQSKLYSGTALKATGNAVKISEGESNNPGSGNGKSTPATVNNGGRDTSDIASTGYVTLENGTESEQVKTLQKRLKDLGYYSGNIDGRFGEGTQAAVMAFQLRNNLTVDGKAGPATQRVLYGSKANITYASMREGEEGTSVKNLQYTLYELGYYDGSIDGKYGATTADAVREFQIQNKLTPVDGIAGSKTLSKLYSSDAVSATASNVEYDTAKSGDKGDLVVQIQDCLIQLGFLDSITGEYDETTVAAVKAFQSANGLNPDGKCGTMTLQVLFGY